LSGQISNGEISVIINFADLTTQAFDANNLMCAIDPRSGMFLTASVVYRGDVPTQQVDEETLRIQTQYSNNFVDWIPHNVKTACVDIPHDMFTRSATMLCNTTAMVGMFERILNNFDKMLQKKAFLHWYTACGMTEQDFTEAQANMDEVKRAYLDAASQEDNEQA
jgi:tubulin beta